MKRIILILLFISPIPLYAKKYPVETDRDDIVCTVKKYTQSQMLKLFSANLVNHNFDTITDESSNYMAVKLTLENNSQSTISIDSEDYLEGVGGAALYKRLFLRRYSKLINESGVPATGLFVLGSLCSVIGVIGIVATGIGLIGLANYNNDDGELMLGFIFGIPGLVYGVAGLALFAAGFSEISKNKLLNMQHAQLRKYVLGSAWLKKQVDPSEEKSKEKIFSPKTSVFTIPPGHVFSDIFFIDLTKANRDIFERTEPKLAYEEVEQ